MSATEELVAEHRVILDVLSALEHTLAAAGQTRQVPVPFLRNLVTFSRGFIDRCHHGKEERCLLPCVHRRGIPLDHGLVPEILQEHERGRALTRQVAQALDRYDTGTATADDILDPCWRFLDLLRQHIMKEHEALFPLGEGVMGPQDHDETRRCFAEKEHEVGHGEHDRLIRLAEEMARPW